MMLCCLSYKSCIGFSVEFFIEEQYLTHVSVRDVRSNLENPDEPTAEDLIKILKDEHITVRSYSHKDHPIFTELREHLEDNGYIKTERHWWNGDRVMKPFSLNGYQFEIGEKFPCAAAIADHMKFNSKYKD